MSKPYKCVAIYTPLAKSKHLNKLEIKFETSYPEETKAVLELNIINDLFINHEFAGQREEYKKDILVMVDVGGTYVEHKEFARKRNEEKKLEAARLKQEEYQSWLDKEVQRVNQIVSELKAGERIRFDNLDIRVYHATRGTSSSQVKEFASTCPANYFANNIDEDKKYLDSLKTEKTKEYFEIGNAIHCLALETEEYEKRFVMREHDKRTNAYKEWRANLPTSVIDLSPAIYYEQQFFIKKMQVNQDFRNCINGGKSEVSIYYNHPWFGLLKCRPDYLVEVEDHKIAYDIKTVECASVNKVNKAILDLQYYLQAGFYRLVANLDDFRYIAIEKHYPFTVTAPVKSDSDLNDWGYAKAINILKDMKIQFELIKWKGYIENGFTAQIMYPSQFEQYEQDMTEAQQFLAAMKKNPNYLQELIDIETTKEIHELGEK